MATLNTACGWVSTDPANLLIASGLGVSSYTMNEIISCMNEVCNYAPGSIGDIQDLLDQFQSAQASMSTLNSSSNGKTLVKADVLEWEADKSVGTGYSPEREIMRIRSLLLQYMSGCMIMPGYNDGGVTSVVRS